MITVEIPMQPIPKGRPRRGQGGHWYTPERTRAYEEAVAWYAAGTRAPRVDAPCAVRIVLRLTRLAGDLDNYAKSILDGLVKGRLLADDDLVHELTVQLVLGVERREERADVYIVTELEPVAS